MTTLTNQECREDYRRGKYKIDGNDAVGSERNITLSGMLLGTLIAKQERLAKLAEKESTR